MKKAVIIILFLSLSILGFAQFDPVNRLILDLPFNGNANDQSGNNNNGLVHGALLTEDRFGIPYSAYDFANGAMAYIEIPASSTMDSVTIYSGYTIIAWIKPHSWNSGGTPLLAIIERHNDLTDGGNNFLAFPNGLFYSNDVGSFDFSLDRWYNVAMNIDPEFQAINYYVDGVNVGTFPYTIPIDTSNHGPYSIGTSFTGNTDEYSDGVIDDIKIYARTLSPEEIGGINGLSQIPNTDFQLFPSPASNEIKLRHASFNAKPFICSIYNAIGEQVLPSFSFNQPEVSIDIHQLSSGIYYLKTNGPSMLSVKRFVKE